MSSHAYNLESLKLPRVAGWPLRALAAALDVPVLGPALVGHLKRQGGIHRIGQWRLAEPPTLFPKAPAQDDGPVTGELDIEAVAEDGPFCSTGTLAGAYRDGSLTPAAVARRCLKIIEESDREERPLRAFISVLPDDVMRQAEDSAARHAAGEPKGILDGVPVAVKDELDQRPHATTAGTRFMGSHAAARDATVVSRLRAAGAVLIGKASMHEIGINPNGLNVHHGPCRNPYDRARDTGGSSSGPAAAVAAGICPAAIGADGGGSIRIPAAQCGIVGLKPTFGRVSEDGAAPLTFSLAHVGPLGATVADCAAVYAAIAGPDPSDANSLGQPPPTLARWREDHLEGIRLGVFRPWFEHAADAVVAANDAMLGKLCAAGARVVPVAIPELDEMRVAHAATILAEMAASMDALRVPRSTFGPPARINLSAGRSFGADDYIACQRMRTRSLRTFAGVFEQVDAVVSPACAVVAPPIPPGALPHGWSDLGTETEVMRYAFPANLTGLPAIAFPAGYTDAGLPIGMQAMANHWDEALLLRIAGVAERRQQRRAPAGYASLLG